MKIKDLLNECRRQFSEKNYQEAIKVCNEILKMDSNNQIALEYKARSLYLQDECEEALALLNNALTLYPNNHYYLYIKAEVLMDKEEYGKAVECFEAILEMGVSDEDDPNFIKMYYETCLGLRRDELIEKEKYVDAWKCYVRLSEIRLDNLERSALIDRFKRHVKNQTTKNKKRQYYVKISSDEAKLKLIRFLKENGFKSNADSGLLFLIDVVDKTYNCVSSDEAKNIISESKFYDKVNYYPRDMIVHKKIFGEDGRLAYEGYTIYNAPYGFGKAYFANGNIYREGIFDIKGIVQGKEYYPSGQLRFEGQWCLTGGYGPNAPCLGNAYDEDGKLIYCGKFEIKRGGVGYPMIQKPKGFRPEQKERPKIEYL